MADSFSNQMPNLRNPPSRPVGQRWTPLMWPNVGLFTSLMPFLNPEATPFPTFQRFHSISESIPLSDDEKLELIRLQEEMRNREPTEWGEPI